MEIAHILSVQRLQRLQKLCAEPGSDAELPGALLFISGQDGRNNAGSNNAVKFLFQPCGALELQRDDGIVDNDALEEIVVLVTRSRLCIFYPDTAAAMVEPVAELADSVLTWTASTRNVEEFQRAKVHAFKQMCIATLAEGEVVGVPIPLGYDEVQEVEQWPLIQSFALDDVVTSTGFFTLRYAVVDITYDLRNIFRALDGVAVARALVSAANETAVHIRETTSILTANHSCHRRSLLTPKDIVAPLELLFESSCIQLNFAVDPALAPRVWIGMQTSAINERQRKRVAGEHDAAATIGTLGASGDHATHLIIEASDPANGLRFCRTWFLAVGELLAPLQPFGEESLQERHQPRSEFRDTASRLRNLYTHLCLTLRFAVYASLTGGHTDLKGAAQSIHAKITTLMHKALGEQEPLLEDESLSINIDCMDACGKIIHSGEVEEVGGACFLYVRASIDAVRLHGESLGAVAVGDTFAFHPESGHSALLETPEAVHMQLYSDEVCLTAEPAIPYIQLWPATGAEEQAVHQTHVNLKDFHKLREIGMGPAFEPVESHPVEAITSHPLFVHCVGQLRAYEGGFNLRHAIGDSAPLPIVFSQHVSHVWTGMASDFEASSSHTHDTFVLGIFFTPAGQRGFNATFPAIGKRAEAVHGSAFFALLIPTTGHLWDCMLRYLDRWRVEWRKNDVRELRNTFADLPEAEHFQLSFRLWAKGCAPFTARTAPALEHLFLGGDDSRKALRSADASLMLLKQHLPLRQFVAIEHPEAHLRYEASTVVVCSLPGAGAYWVADQLLESTRRQKLGSEWVVVRLCNRREMRDAEADVRGWLKRGVCVILATESVLHSSNTLASLSNLAHLKSWVYVHNEQLSGTPTATAAAAALPVQWAGWQRSCLDRRWCTHVLTLSKAKQSRPEFVAWKSRLRHSNRDLNFVTASSNVLDHDVVEEILIAEDRISTSAAPRLCSVTAHHTSSQAIPASLLPCLGVTAERHEVELGLAPLQFDCLLALLSTVFPQAKSFVPATRQQEWSGWPAAAAPADGDQRPGWKRLVDAAVVQGLLGAAVKERQKAWSAKLGDKARFQKKILALEGTVLCGSTWVRVEADSANLLVSAASSTHSNNEAMLTIWVASSTSGRGLARQIDAMIRECQTPTLNHKPLLQVEQLTPELRQTLSQQNAGRSCPPGWAFDGEAYVDFTGARTYTRPDLDEIVEQYIAEANANASKYNRLADKYNALVSQLASQAQK